MKINVAIKSIAIAIAAVSLLNISANALYLTDTYGGIKQTENVEYISLTGNFESGRKTSYTFDNKDADKSLYSTDSKLTIDRWNGWELDDSHKYLISDTVLHIFDSQGKYIQSINKEESDNSIIYTGEYVTKLEKEEEVYQWAEFDSLPKYHVTTLKEGNCYKNQLENKVYPKITCAPTSIAMKMQMDGFEFNESTITYEDYLNTFKKGIQANNETGISVNDCINSLRKMDLIGAYTIYQRYDRETIINDILTSNSPLIAVIDQKTIIANYTDSRFYLYQWNNSEDIHHAIVITGFYIMDNGDVGFEIYDPMSKTSIDKRPAGMGIFMKEKDFIKLIESNKIYSFETLTNTEE